MLTGCRPQPCQIHCLTFSYFVLPLILPDCPDSISGMSAILSRSAVVCLEFINSRLPGFLFVGLHGSIFCLFLCLSFPFLGGVVNDKASFFPAVRQTVLNCF